MLQSIGNYLLFFVAWVLVILGIGTIVGAIGWEVWQGQIRPRLISSADLEAIADELATRYGDRAEEVAFLNEDRASRHSDSFEQGKWRRVRQCIGERRKRKS